MEEIRKDPSVKPDRITLNSYLSVYAEAVYPAKKIIGIRHNEFSRIKAYEIFDSFDKYGLVPDAFSFKALIRMHIRMKQIESAIQVKEIMNKKGILLNEEGYGLLVDALTHRGMVVEALNMIEEASDKNVTIAEKHLKLVRARCKKLGFRHPNITEDPLLWAKEIKVMRRTRKSKSERKIRPLQNAYYV